MIRFASDYAEGAHTQVLKLLGDTNFEQLPGYGEDVYCEAARQSIREACMADNADVHFLVGGTQANATVIGAALRPHQGVITTESGHINGQETGAVEATGHKLITVDSKEGRVSAAQVQSVYDAHYGRRHPEHTVQPGMVYISHPTEYGTIYTKDELCALSAVCRHCGLILYMDGARLGYGLAAPGSDLTLPDIAQLCDVFFIGGTKVGALCGEAVVITNKALQKDFAYHIKQHGGMLAKGRILGIQFLGLFEDDLYVKIAAHAVAMALRIKSALEKKGYTFLYASNTNQQFPILPNEKIDQLLKKYVFGVWEKVDDGHTAIRLCTSWATKETDVRSLIEDIATL